VSFAGVEMHYEKSWQIEQRLIETLELIQAGKYSTPELAERLGVSVPTVSRSIQALRERGNAIIAEKVKGSWHYELTSSKQAVTK
jgi:biotin operon repressor